MTPVAALKEFKTTLPKLVTTVTGVLAKLLSCANVILVVPTSILPMPLDAFTVIVPFALLLPSLRLPLARPASLTEVCPGSTPFVSVIVIVGSTPSEMVPVPVTAAVLRAVAADKVMVSLPSTVLSTTVATRTIKLDTPAGTLTTLPDSVVQLAPPSVEYCWVLVSVPSVAVPELGVTVTAVGVVLVLLKLTVKSKFPPSLTLGLDTPVIKGRSSSPPGPGTSSRIVVVTLLVAIVAFVAAVKLT